MKMLFFSFKPAVVILLFFCASLEASTISVSYINPDVYYYHPGDTIKIFYELRFSNPSGEIKNVSLELYLSSDTTITTSDFKLGSRTENVGQGEYGWGSWLGNQIPMDYPTGSYYVGIIVSAASFSNITYCNLNPVTIDPKLSPDIIVNYIGMYPDNFFPGDQGKILFTVKNIGSYKAENTYVHLYGSTDSTITDDDYYLGGATIGSLAIGQETASSKEWDFKVPNNIPIGDYFIGGIAFCSANETNLENNTFRGYTFSVVNPIDISVDDVIIDSGIYRPGNSINITTTTKNVGNFSSGEYTIDLYATNNIATSLLLGSFECSSLEPGKQETFNTLCQFPANIPPDYYYILAFIECHNDIDVDNNYAESYSPVWVGPLADLSVELVDVNNVVYMPGDQIKVYTLIKNIGDGISEGYSVDFYISPDTAITEQDLHIGSVSREALAAGAQHSYNTTCQFPQVPLGLPAGDYYIGIIVTCPIDYFRENNTGYDMSTCQVVHPAGLIYGQTRYRTQIPIRYAQVKIFAGNNNNISPNDRIIGQTYTNSNGIYSVIIPEDINNAAKIYVKVIAEGAAGAYPTTTNNICNVKDDVFNQTYSIISPLYLHPHNSSLRADLKITSNDYPDGAFCVYDSIIEGFIQTKTILGIEPNEITAYWPSSYNMTFYTNDPNAGIFIAQGDRSDRDVILHEYGHYIADINDFAQGAVGENSTHYWNLDLRSNPVYRTDEHAKNLAFREAWATLFGIAIQYKQTYSTTYDDYDEISRLTYTVDLEKYSKGNYTPGQYFENMNSCVLWDIFDNNNDSADNNDTLSDTSMVKIWTTMNLYKPDDIIDFWNGWFKSFQYTAEMTRIFNNHYIEH
jgi:hypothetical protein